jgi:hypothetical protein
MKKYVFSALLAVLTLTACDKVSPAGILIANTDVDDRIKMSRDYYRIHEGDLFLFKQAPDGEYTFLVGADSHLTTDPGRMREMLQIGIDDDDLFYAHLGDIADTKAEYYIILDSVITEAKEKYGEKHFRPVTYQDDYGYPHTIYMDTVSQKIYQVNDVPLPFHPVVGNHDITNNGWALWTSMFHSSFYIGYVYVKNDDDEYLDRLIFIDSASGTLGEEQIDEIESHFFEVDDSYKDIIKLRHTFVFGHTNIFRPSASEFASTFTREETYYLLDKFDHWNASIVFSGHVHDWDEREVGGITYLTLDTMCEENRPEPGDYLVRVHVKRDGTISWKKVHMSYTPSK